ncbi:MAG: hypothetical protein IJ461_10905, partial [Clostridia bacterium]|nr:hypothetical protein [Clostridia bacterium]
GHAIATCIRMPHTQIKRVSVIPSSRGAAGYVMSVPEDRLFQRRRDLEDHLVVVLAGRAAEETAYGPQGVTTGAAGDLQKAYQLALDMVSKWGMSPSGQVMEPSARQQEAASCLVEDAYRQAMEIIKEHRLAWLKLREELMKRETLSGDQVRSIVEI